MELLETILHSFVNLAMLLFEYIGVVVITFAGIQGFINYIRRKPETRLILAKGLAMGLEFKLGSEILRTVIVRSLNEIYIVAGIIALRAVLTFLIHWEIKNEENEHHRKTDDEKSSNANCSAKITADAAVETKSNDAGPVEVTAEEKSSDDSSAEMTAEEKSSDNSSAEITAEEKSSDNSSAEVTAEEKSSDDSSAEVTAEEKSSDDSSAEAAEESTDSNEESKSLAETSLPNIFVEEPAAENSVEDEISKLEAELDAAVKKYM